MKILPYMDTFTVFLVLTLALALGNAYTPFVTGVVTGFAAFLPPPITSNSAAAIVFLALIGTIILKLLDAPPAHLYRYGAKRGQFRRFENRYGKTKGQRVYGATVGKIKRQRERNR